MMINGRKPRPIFFVCIAIRDNAIVSQQIQAVSEEEAMSLFCHSTGLKAEVVYGPFRLKRKQFTSNIEKIVFSDKQVKAIYNDWEVNALYLKEPENHAMLIFIKRVDNVKQNVPKGTVVVPISELRSE